MPVIKSLYQLFQREYLPVVLRAPSQKSHVIDYRLRDESLIDQVFVRGMSAPLAQLPVVLIRNQRAVHIHGDLPSKRSVETVIFRCGRQIFISSHHMCDPHKMVVHHICKIISRIAVGLYEDHIVQLTVRHCNVSVYFIMESRLAFIRNIEPDHPRFPGRKIRFCLFPAQSQTVFVIDDDIRPVL